jgi:hypothetical protein
LTDDFEDGDRRLTLRADCTRCFGLCCVLPGFTKSAEFAIDKAPGTPCPNLRADFRCAIHADLRGSGFAGCATYDCFGAGQRVAQDVFGGRDWRQAPETAASMFAAFTALRQLHELLWYLAEAAALPVARTLLPEITAATQVTEALAAGDGDTLAALDVGPHRDEVNVTLLRVSEVVRAQAPPPTADHRGADLVGHDLAGADLRGANLRGAQLIGAVLRDADLRFADLVGADLRGADLRGADLSSSVFVTQVQVNSARGDTRTRLPAFISTPAHWG